jgi:hypothetical protein
MSMLPQLKLRTYYDLVVRVAIVRPGPIQGGTWCTPISAGGRAFSPSNIRSRSWRRFWAKPWAFPSSRNRPCASP